MPPTSCRSRCSARASHRGASRTGPCPSSRRPNHHQRCAPSDLESRRRKPATAQTCRQESSHLPEPGTKPRRSPARPLNLPNERRTSSPSPAPPPARATGRHHQRSFRRRPDGRHGAVGQVASQARAAARQDLSRIDHDRQISALSTVRWVTCRPTSPPKFRIAAYSLWSARNARPADRHEPRQQQNPGLRAGRRQNGRRRAIGLARGIIETSYRTATAAPSSAVTAVRRPDKGAG